MESKYLPEKYGQWYNEISQNSLQKWGSTGWRRCEDNKHSIQRIKYSYQTQLPLRKLQVILHADPVHFAGVKVIYKILNNCKDCCDGSKHHNERQ